MLSVDEIAHVQRRIAKSRPAQVRIFYGTGIRRGVRPHNSGESDRKVWFLAFNQLADGHSYQFELIAERIGAVVQYQEIQIGRIAGETLGEFAYVFFGGPLGAEQIWIKRWQVARGDEANTWNGADVIDVFGEATKSGLRFFSGALRGRLPRFARWICAAPEIDSIPKLLMDPFTGMIEHADQSAALTTQL